MIHYVSAPLTEILDMHKRWIQGEPDGEQAIIYDHHLMDADLRGADLRKAILGGCDLRHSDLRDTDLTYADLHGSDLRGADLRGSNLRGTNLSGCNFKHADLRDTCLDPLALPNGGLSEDTFEEDVDGFLIGYRTHIQIYQGGKAYEYGKDYTAPVFSVCPHTKCHPGLYVVPSPRRCGPGLLIRVKFRREDLHSVGDKYRVRRFTVVRTTWRNRLTFNFMYMIIFYFLFYDDGASDKQ